MANANRDVRTAEELIAAARDSSISHIVMTCSLTDVPSVRLSSGQTLAGQNSQVQCRFQSGTDGLQLSTDNTVERLHLISDLNRRAIFNDTSVDSLGVLKLQGLMVEGVVQLLARDKVRSGHVEVQRVDVIAADARAFPDRPKEYGVEVIPGAFALWNQQTDATVTITANLSGLSAGREGAPVRGSGIFVSGGGDVGGRLVVSQLETGPVFSDGGIASGTADRISAGVFTCYGAFVDRVRNTGPVTTYGSNDMVLDNWGTVDLWVAEEKVTSYGPSAIGFVNFGDLNTLQVDGMIETFGQGSRGFNVYGGTVRTAEFERVVTHADGAVGIQISKPVGEIRVRRGVETNGGIGDSLVKGVVIKLAAIPFSVKPGGAARLVEIKGGLVSRGAGVPALELHGMIESLDVSGGFTAAGGGFDQL